MTCMCTRGAMVHTEMNDNACLLRVLTIGCGAGRLEAPARGVGVFPFARVQVEVEIPEQLPALLVAHLHHWRRDGTNRKHTHTNTVDT